MALTEITQGTGFWQPFRPDYYAADIAEIESNLVTLAGKFIQLPDRTIYYVDSQLNYYLAFDEYLRPSFLEETYLPASSSFIFVGQKSDLPTASAEVITLDANTCYWFTTSVDLTGDRLLCGQNTVIRGSSSENSRIFSTGLSAATALITSQWSIPILNITLQHGTALALDAGANENQAIDWFGVNFTNCDNIGLIANYGNVIWTDCAVLNSSGLTFDGTIGTIGMSSSLFDADTGGTIITIAATATITRRFRIIYSSFIASVGEIAINVSTSANIPVEGYQLDRCNFSGGGTYNTGVQYTDNKTWFINNRGINNSEELAYYTMNSNLTATIIDTAGVAVKVAGTTTFQDISQKFDTQDVSNRARYTGAITRDFQITILVSVTSGNGNQIGVYVAKNGVVVSASESYGTANASGRVENITCQSILSLATNDYIEVFVENDAATNNITATELSVIVKSLN